MRGPDEPLYTTEHAVSGGRDARWLARRARNVARRPLVLALFASGGFLVALLAIILTPVGLERVQRPRIAIPAAVDTTPLVEAVRRERVRTEGAEAALITARAEARARPDARVTRDTLPRALRARRDSLAARAASVAAALGRAADAPLPASYRAVGELPELALVEGVPAMLDSLQAIERARDSVGALGAADTTFMALTVDATILGDSLITLAEERLRAMRREIAALTPVVVPEPPPITIDTMPFRAALDASRRSLVGAQARLTDARGHNASVIAARARAQAGTERAASPPMRIAAAGAIGIALGFLLALAGEIRRPSVADAREAETAAGVPVLAHLAADATLTQRTRRRADLDVPPLIELTTDRYERLYYRLADVVARLPRLAILGEEPAIVATVAANLAAVAARTARATLLLDTDFDSQSVAAVMRVRTQPGVAEVLARRLHWSAAITHAVVGRNRVVDVLPAGTMKGGGSLASAAESFGAEVSNIARRYDTVIISAPASRRGAVSAVAAAVPDAIICVRTAHTSVRLLQRVVDESRRDGLRIRGVVLWDRDEPRLLPVQVTAAPTRAVVTAQELERV